MRLFSTKHETPAPAPAPMRYGQPWHIAGDTIFSHKGSTIASLGRINLLLRSFSKDEIEKVYALNLSHDARAASLGISYNDMHNLHEVFAGRVSNGAIVDGKLVEVTEPTEAHVKVEQPRTITVPIDDVVRELTELDTYINAKLAAALRTLADLLEGK